MKAFDRQYFINVIFFMLVSAAVSLKHISFKEEREWRVVYLPDRNPSPLMRSSIEVFGGIPQVVYKIPLEENPKSNVVGVGIPALLDRLIIGPNVYAIPMWTAFVRVLKEAGVADAEKRVILSNIPIRS